MYQSNCFLALKALLCAALPLSAQSTSNLSGTVCDQSGALMPGVHVVCPNPQTGFVRTIETNEAGIFRCTELPIGVYEVVLTRAGFQTLRQENLELVTAHVADLTVDHQP